jgi:hypothetical protein
MSTTTPDVQVTSVAPSTAYDDVHARAFLVDGIIREATAAGVPCDPDTAEVLIGALENAAGACTEPGSVYYFTQPELNAMHRVLDVVMPDETTPTPGSVHEALDSTLLGDDQVTFRHTRRIRDGEPGVRYCAVYVGVLVV